MSYFQSIYADENLPHRCKTVYIYLKDRSSTSGSCWPGVKTIASDLGLSCSTVKRALKELEDTGWIRKRSRYRENGSSTSNLYTILRQQPQLMGRKNRNRRTLPPREVCACLLDRGAVHDGCPRRDHSIGVFKAESIFNERSTRER